MVEEPPRSHAYTRTFDLMSPSESPDDPFERYRGLTADEASALAAAEGYNLRLVPHDQKYVTLVLWTNMLSLRLDESGRVRPMVR